MHTHWPLSRPSFWSISRPMITSISSFLNFLKCSLPSGNALIVADNVEDNEDKNLSWLFNFKLDEIANLSPEIKRKRTNTNHQQQQHQQQHGENHQQQNYYNSSQQQMYDDGNQQRSAKDPCIEDDLNVAENIVISNAPPPYSSHT